MAYTVGSKGQVVIDKELRDQLGVGPGWLTIQRRVGDRIEIRFIPPEHERSLFGSLAPFIKRAPPVAGDEEMDEAVGRGITREWQETEGRNSGEGEQQARDDPGANGQGDQR
jgi:bifunctional DNA-binding transcriptional regulator/antitoxin component of YhaV-PrlF toxin-antitoxin module